MMKVGSQPYRLTRSLLLLFGIIGTIIILTDQIFNGRMIIVILLFSIAIIMEFFDQELKNFNKNYLYNNNSIIIEKKTENE